MLAGSTIVPVDAAQRSSDNSLMSSIDVAIPEDLRRFVDERTRETHHASPDEYVHSLIRADQRRVARARLEQKLLEGLDSGEGVEVTPDYLDNLQHRMQEKIDARRDAEAAASGDQS